MGLVHGVWQGARNIVPAAHLSHCLRNCNTLHFFFIFINCGMSANACWVFSGIFLVLVHSSPLLPPLPSPPPLPSAPFSRSSSLLLSSSSSLVVKLKTRDSRPRLPHGSLRLCFSPQSDWRPESHAALGRQGLPLGTRVPLPLLRGLSAHGQVVSEGL